jgi:rRNA maturation RNase YbeY
MINLNYELDFELPHVTTYTQWAEACCTVEGFAIGTINFIFCDDAYLLKMNQDYLDHDYYTDIITFDYVQGKVISGDIFISVERVRENADTFGDGFDEELTRVMAHGLLHLMGYKDGTSADQALMRKKEEEKLKMFHVER